MPEHRQAHQPPPVRGDQSALRDLHHERQQPDDAEGHVQAVRAHQREKRRQERAALRPVAFFDQMREFVQLDADKAGAKQTGNREPGQSRASTIAPHRDHHEAVGDR